jgi:hypothetical protein
MIPGLTGARRALSKRRNSGAPHQRRERACAGPATPMQGANETKASSTLVSADTCTFGWNYPKKDLRAARSFRISSLGAEVRAEVERAEVYIPGGRVVVPFRTSGPWLNGCQQEAKACFDSDCHRH